VAEERISRWRSPKFWICDTTLIKFSVVSNQSKWSDQNLETISSYKITLIYKLKIDERLCT
jgi:hypothetical protein